MGAGASWPALVAELNVSEPAVSAEDRHASRLSLGCFFCQVHTEAGGTALLPGWSQPHLVGLCADDVITLSLFTARSQADFDCHRRSEFAQVHLPCSDVKEAVEKGEEIFCMGLDPAAPWLDPGASYRAYSESFKRSLLLARADLSAPCVRVQVSWRELRSLGPELRSYAKAGAFSGGDASGSSLPRLGLLPGGSHRCPSGRLDKDWNQGSQSPSRSASPSRINSHLSLSSGYVSDGSVGSPAGPRGRQADRLRVAQFTNYALKTELQTVFRELELAVGTVGTELVGESGRTMSEPSILAPRICVSEPASAAHRDAMSMPNSSISLISSTSLVDEDAEADRQATLLMLEIQDITESNLELMSRYDGQIKALEQEVVSAKLRVSLAREQARRTPVLLPEPPPLPRVCSKRVGFEALASALGGLQSRLGKTSASQQKAQMLAQHRAKEEQLEAEAELSALRSAADSAESARRERQQLMEEHRRLRRETDSARISVEDLDVEIQRQKEQNESLRERTEFYNQATKAWEDMQVNMSRAVPAG